MGAPELLPNLRLPWWGGLVGITRSGRPPGWVGPIGLAFADDHACFAQFARDLAGIRPRALARIPFEGDVQALFADPKRLADLVRAALATGRFRGRRVVSCLPAGRSHVMVVNYKAESEAQVTASVVAVARERLKGELEQSVLDYVPVRFSDDAKGSGSAIVAVASRAEVFAHCDALARAGLIPEAVDLAPAALCRLVRASSAPGSDSALVVQFQNDASGLMVMHAGRLIVQRDIEIGVGRILERLTSALEIDAPSARALLGGQGWSGTSALDGWADGFEAARVIDDVLRPVLSELVTEIDRTLVYLASKTRGGTVTTIQLNGGAAAYPCVLEYVRRHIGIPVQVLDPWRMLGAGAANAPAAWRDGCVEFALASGLALRGAVDLG